MRLKIMFNQINDVLPELLFLREIIKPTNLIDGLVVVVLHSVQKTLIFIQPLCKLHLKSRKIYILYKSENYMLIASSSKMNVTQQHLPVTIFIRSWRNDWTHFTIIYILILMMNNLRSWIESKSYNIHSNSTEFYMLCDFEGNSIRHYTSVFDVNIWNNFTVSFQFNTVWCFQTCASST